jgi:hypothetical protein
MFSQIVNFDFFRRLDFCWFEEPQILTPRLNLLESVVSKTIYHDALFGVSGEFFAGEFFAGEFFAGEFFAGEFFARKVLRRRILRSKIFWH